MNQPDQASLGSYGMWKIIIKFERFDPPALTGMILYNAEAAYVGLTISTIFSKLDKEYQYAWRLLRIEVLRAERKVSEQACIKQKEGGTNDNQNGKI